MSLFVLVPNQIADLTVSTIAEPDPNKVMPDGSVGEVAWVSATSYSENQRVIRTQTHRVYRCIAAVSGTTAPENDPFHWFDEGPTNKWAWHDSQASTQTISTSPYTITCNPGICTDLEFFGLSNVYEIGVEVKDETGGTVVFEQTITTEEYSGSDPHWSFYFDGPSVGNTASITGIPVYSDCEVSITLTSYDGNDLGIGLIGFGSYEYLGMPEIGFEAVYRDYGYTDVDRWGNSVRTPGKKAKDLRGSALLDIYEVNGVDATVRRLLDAGAVFVPSTDTQFRFLKTWGMIKPASIQAFETTHAMITIEVEGLI